MAAVNVITLAGKKSGDVELDDAVFGVEPNIPLMHQVVTAQLAARRSGTQSTRTRAEVAGGGAKPWKQKGTGRARAGSIRAPHWRGGGVALGPKPRSYAQRTPKKMIRAALRAALSDRAAEGKVIVVDAWDFEAPSTKAAVAFLEAIEATGRTLVVVDPSDTDTVKSFRNLRSVHICAPRELNAYDVLVSDVVVFAKDTLPGAEGGRTEGADGQAAASARQSSADDDTQIAEGGRTEGADGQAAASARQSSADDDTQIAEGGRTEGEA